MRSFTTKNEYIDQFKQVLDQKTKEKPMLEAYVKKQWNHLNQLMKRLSPETF